jgi:hypothetical protein
MLFFAWKNKDKLCKPKPEANERNNKIFTVVDNDNIEAES